MLIAAVTEPQIFSLDWIRDHGPRIGVLLALAFVVSWGARVGVRRFRRRLEGTVGVTAELNLHRSTTLVGTMASALRVTVWTVVVLMILGELGFNLGPLLAGAGVAGIALGFGAQSLVKDFLAGFFILLENQFGVGESVELSVTGGTVAGRVAAMSLRSTAVRATDGTLSVVPNGNIQFASNKSRGVGDVVVHVDVPSPQEGTKSVRERLDRVVGELRTDPSLQSRLSGGPVAVDVEPTTDEVRVTVAAKARPSRRSEVEEEIRRRVERGLKPGRQPRPKESGSAGS